MELMNVRSSCSGGLILTTGLLVSFIWLNLSIALKYRDDIGYQRRCRGRLLKRSRKLCSST